MLGRTAERLLRGSGSAVRRLASSSRGDTGVLDDYHITPMGNSDVPQRTRVSFLSDDMIEAKQIGVRGLSCYGFRLIDGSFLYGPVALFPKNALSWRVHTPDDITPESLSLFTLLEPKIDVLVIGVGDKKNIDKVRARIYPYLRDHKIGLEISDTEDAIATFNFLNAENRYVAAALYPPDDMVVTDAEHSRALVLLKNWDELDENPLLAGITGTSSGYDEYDDIIKRVWRSDASWEEVKRALVKDKDGDEKKDRPKIADK